MSDLIERLRSNAQLPICPFDKRSPEYLTTPNDKPCKFCGGEPEGTDKCTGADMRIMSEAADKISALMAVLEPFAEVANEYDEASDEQQVWPTFTVGDFRAAREALAAREVAK